jgi:pimeloyl-[acyl-carrier protein] methyl ester esterase
MPIYKTIKGSGKDIILLHGWGCDSRHMQSIVDSLASHFRIQNIDLPGAGRSDWDPGIRTIHDFADQLLKELPKTAIYIGWSFGALVTISIASRYPDRVERLIGIGSTPKFIASQGWLGVPQPGFKAHLTKMESSKDYNIWMKGFFDHEFADLNPKPEAYHHMLHLLEQKPSRNLDAFLKGIEIVDAADLRKEFASIKCPIDLIIGDQDDAVPMVSFEQIKKLNSAAKIHIIEGAHHMPFWTHLKQFNKILNDILRHSLNN